MLNCGDEPAAGLMRSTPLKSPCRHWQSILRKADKSLFLTSFAEANQTPAAYLHPVAPHRPSIHRTDLRDPLPPQAVCQ
jgi:hypothetical protein